jgi:hypothetical protein
MFQVSPRWRLYALVYHAACTGWDELWTDIWYRGMTPEHLMLGMLARHRPSGYAVGRCIQYVNSNKS